MKNIGKYIVRMINSCICIYQFQTCVLYRKAENGETEKLVLNESDYDTFYVASKEITTQQVITAKEKA